MTSTTQLFVYGTLRPPVPDCSPADCFNFPKVVPYLQEIAEAWLDGGELYDLGSFPAAIPGDGRIHGALLKIDPSAFEVLDPLEGHPDLYRREQVIAETHAGPIEAWIYWAPEELALAGRRIDGGDWLKRPRQKGKGGL